MYFIITAMLWFGSTDVITHTEYPHATFDSVPTCQEFLFKNKVKLLKDIFETGIILNLIFIYSIVLSFIVSYLTIKYFLVYVKNFNLNIFIYYRILLALILFVIVYN